MTTHLDLMTGESDSPLAVINGRGRTGKTSLAKRIIDTYQGRVLLFDGKRDVELEGGEYIEGEIESLAGWFLEKRDEPAWRLAYWPGRDLHEELDKLSTFLMKVGDVAHAEGKRWPLLLVLDEFAVLKGQGVYVSESFAELARVRGKWGFVLLLISHRPRDIPPAYLFDVTHWFSFRQKRKDDLAYIYDFTQADNVEGIRGLERWSYAAWADKPGKAADNFRFYDRHDQAIPDPTRSDPGK